MAEQISYHDGDIVWVKMNKLWWPGEVHESHRLPSDFFDQFKKPPLVIVKFFQEQNYHYVNQLHQIARFNCAKKNEFIKKGLDLYYGKHTYMTEFPADVAIAEKRTGGNPNIIYSKEFMPVVKPDKTTPVSVSKGSTSRSRRVQPIETNTPSIPRVMIKPDHDTRILAVSSPPVKPLSSSSSTTATATTPTPNDNKYKCTSCNYSTNRINTFVWHQKTHNSPKTLQTSAASTVRQTPSTSTISADETKSSSASKLQSEDENVSEIDEKSKPAEKIAEPTKVDRTPKPVALSGKSKAKRTRQTTEPKVVQKTPKTDNKLKKILDDWSDDEFGEAGPSEMPPVKIHAKCIASEAENSNDVKEECSSKKRLKFDNESTEEIESASVPHDHTPKIESLIPSETDDKIEHQTDLDVSSINGEPSTRQSVRRQNNDPAKEETTPQTRFSLRSGRTPVANEMLTVTPKRRGRAKRNANDSLKSEPAPSPVEIEKSEVDPVAVSSEKRETIEHATTSSSDKCSEELVNPVPVPEKGASKSHSKTSRKGKPRRKEEIKLANNVSVAVLVEKTSPSTDNGIEQKPSAEDNQTTNVAHPKMSCSSPHLTDDHRKSIESMEVSKEPEPMNESDNHTVEHKEDETATDAVYSNDKTEENDAEGKVTDALKIPENIDGNVISTPSLDAGTDVTDEKTNENPATTDDIPDEQRVVKRCYERKSTAKKNLQLESSDATTTTTTSLSAYDSSMDDYESPSSSNLRQRAPKRYENTRNRRKSDRRTASDDDFTAAVKEIDDNCEKDDRARQKSVDSNNSLRNDDSKLSEVLNGSGKEGTDSASHFDQSSENSNSKTSTPEKADTSKELDCFDFTEDECMKPPEVLNRRKRLPPAKVFELEDIDKIEEQRKIDEEAARKAQQREEENQKLHAELENLLNSTTPVVLPEIPVGPKVHENFPERRAEKDPEKISGKDGGDVKERMVPPKERNKRIFKYRNRNRRPDSDTTASCDVEETKTVCLDDGKNVVLTGGDVVEVDAKLPSNDHGLEIDKDKDPSAHDLKIEIAETLINFPLLSPQAELLETSTAKVAVKSVKRKEPTKSTKNIKKARNTAPAPEVCREEIITTKELVHDAIGNENNSKVCVLPMPQEPVAEPAPEADPFPSTQKHLSLASAITTTDTEPPIVSPSSSSSVGDFSRIRLIEKIDSHSPGQLIDETIALKPDLLPLKRTSLTLTQPDGNNFVPQIPKKRKSQMDGDIPAFVIERPNPDATSATNNESHLVKKEPKSFIVTKKAKKEVAGELSLPNIWNAPAGVQANLTEVRDVIESNTKSSASIVQLAHSIPNPLTPITAASEKISSPGIITSQLIIQTKPPTATNAQKRTVTTSSAAENVLGSLSANRPCTIAPAKKASYRRPTDMTGMTPKKIGIDGKGNPVIIYTKISPMVTQTLPIVSQAAAKRIEPIPCTSQLVQNISAPVQSNAGNQFVITSKGALITTTPFITTTHSTQLNQPTLTNRTNIHVHTQLLRSPNLQVFQTQTQQQQQLHHHPSPPSNQIIIQTKPTNPLTQKPSIAPTGKKQTTGRRSAVNKAKITEIVTSSNQIINDNLSQSVYDGNTTATPTFKKQVARRISKNQSSSTTTTQQLQSIRQQQIILNSEINQIGNAPVPPLIPLNDQSASISSSSRKRIAKQQQQPTQRTFVQEAQIQSKSTPPVDVVEQHQENVQEILALPGDTPGFGGPPGSYFLCKVNEMGVYIPIDHQPLYLDVTDNTNLLKPNAPDGVGAVTEIHAMDETEQSSALFELNNEAERVRVAANQAVLADQDASNPKYLINISDGQQLLVDQQSLMALANGEEFPQFVTSDGQQIILQSGQHDILSAIAFAEDVGLIAGQQILIPEEDLAVIQGQGGNHDILAAALAGTEAFSQEQYIDNVLIQATNGVEEIVDPMVYRAMPQAAVPALTNAVTNETNAVLTKPPIMSTLEHPTKRDRISPNDSLELCAQNLDESLAVIGVTTSHTNVPTSLELPITITNPAIAPKTTSTMAAIYPPTGTADHDLDYDIFSSSAPITHLTQSMAINENYRTVNIINSIGGTDLDSNNALNNQFVRRN